MGRLVDLDDVIDTAAAARILGLAQSQSVHKYGRDYPDFPTPVLVLGRGRCVLWLASELRDWRELHPGRGH